MWLEVVRGGSRDLSPWVRSFVSGLIGCGPARFSEAVAETSVIVSQGSFTMRRSSKQSASTGFESGRLVGQETERALIAQ
jgi:hypothetical protein